MRMQAGSSPPLKPRGSLENPPITAPESRGIETAIMRINESRKDPLFMNPAIFIGTAVCLGFVFALQEWVFSRRMGSHWGPTIFFEVWGLHFFLWGTICWLLWRLLRHTVQRASVAVMLLGFLPLSIVVSVIEEMLFVLSFPNVPINYAHLSYWHRLTLFLDEELVYNMVIFWCAFFLFRGMGYYERYRDNERTAAQLEIQLANAQISALRMQLNPHFLFNTMNSISSLMRVDVDAADAMLEQLSSLMRITLERGDAQLITLRDEIEFIETYMDMQARRYAGRVEQALNIDPELYDALVPSMILQPIVENAYIHGLSKITQGGLSVEVLRDEGRIQIRVVNSGIGLGRGKMPSSDGHSVGLSNIQTRLKLHYGDKASFSITEVDFARVQVIVRVPFQLSPVPSEAALRYVAQ
jgi:two-component system LytT family sensor kinase